MARIQLKRGLAASWTSANPLLAAGEVGLETDTGRLKIGTGLATWTALGYYLSAADKGVANGIASLDGTGRVPAAQVPAGLVVDEVALVGDAFQFYSETVPIGDPISLLVAALDGGSPTSTGNGLVDGGTI